MRDAAQDKFDLVVVYEVSRWGRDGADIIESCRTLRRDFGIDVVETSGAFDTRKPGNALVNFMFAGVAEHERLQILSRTVRGRIAKARAGKPWGTLPVGRGYDKKTGKWYVTDLGHSIRAVLERYVNNGDGGLAAAAEGSGINNAATRLSRYLNDGQLAGVLRVAPG
jgi:DNA invertase Pin-like site-specific DNA recombinase